MFKHNATLTFQIATGSNGRDPVTGAPRVQSTPVVVKASLEDASKPVPQNLPGIDENALYLEGRAIEPKYLPESIRVQKTGTLQLERGKDTKLTGKFYLLPNAASRLGLESRFGDFIAGWFQLGVGA